MAVVTSALDLEPGDAAPFSRRRAPVTRPCGPATMQIGERWAREKRSVVLAVPSAILPSERNFLLNPAHPKFRQLRRHKPVAFAFDDRPIGR
ncbi:MAG: RES family NAD+ phosphorylase [Chthoniobacterales bacterium]